MAHMKIDEDAFLEPAWYALQVVIGSEKQVEDSIRARAVSMHQEENIFDVLVPIRKATKVKTKKVNEQVVEEKMIVDENFQPGYVYVKMRYTPECWFVVRNTNKVLGILGSSGGGKAPVPVWDDEIEDIKRQMNIKPEVTTASIDFKGKVGDTVILHADGFEGQEAVIESIDAERQTVRVSYEFMNRTMENEFKISEIELYL